MLVVHSLPIVLWPVPSQLLGDAQTRAEPYTYHVARNPDADQEAYRLVRRHEPSWIYQREVSHAKTVSDSPLHGTTSGQWLFDTKRRCGFSEVVLLDGDFFSCVMRNRHRRGT